MRKILWSLLATVSGLVLLFSYRTSLEGTDTASIGPAGGTSTADTSSGSASSGSSASDSASNDSSRSGSSTSTGSTTSPNAWKDGTYTGDAANTRYGPVQVSITVSGGRITSVDVPEYPDGNRRDAEINQRALPQLVSETLAAQSTQIDMVSGATYTSDGYLQSLQSAIDQAAS